MNEEPDQIDKARRMALAFQTVFGPEGKRNADQQIVMAELHSRSGIDQPSFKDDYCPYKAAQRDGAKIEYLFIQQQLKRAAISIEEKKKIEPKK